ncbi:MAG: PadR family transcriptional regulator [Fibrobacteria bacterium]|nr:PadR family transcriptional regulator [Fibrobacteria bacterium]
MNRYDLVLLGFIAERESSGYDIITAIKRRELDRWAKISTSTVYNRLLRLEKSECIKGRVERDGNRPERTIYSITKKGMTHLRKEVVRHLVGFNDDPRQLGYAFLFATQPREVAKQLEKHARELGHQIAAIEQMIQDEPRPTLHPEGPFLNCMARDHLQVELKYTRAAIEILDDPEKASKLNGWFFLNFGSRKFTNGEEITLPADLL